MCWELSELSSEKLRAVPVGPGHGRLLQGVRDRSVHCQPTAMLRMWPWGARCQDYFFPREAAAASLGG